MNGGKIYYLLAFVMLVQVLRADGSYHVLFGKPVLSSVSRSGSILEAVIDRTFQPQYSTDGRSSEYQGVMAPYVLVAVCEDDALGYTASEYNLVATERENQGVGAVWSASQVIHHSVAPGTVCNSATVWQIELARNWSHQGETVEFGGTRQYYMKLTYMVDDTPSDFTVSFKAVFADERVIREASGLHIPNATFTYPLLALASGQVEQLPFQAFLSSFRGTSQAHVVVCQEFAKHCFEQESSSGPAPPEGSDVAVFLNNFNVGFNFNDVMIDTVLTADTLRTGKRFAIRASSDISHLGRNITVYVGVRIEVFASRPETMKQSQLKLTLILQSGLSPFIIATLCIALISVFCLLVGAVFYCSRQVPQKTLRYSTTPSHSQVFDEDGTIGSTAAYGSVALTDGECHNSIYSSM